MFGVSVQDLVLNSLDKYAHRPSNENLKVNVTTSIIIAQ